MWVSFFSSGYWDVSLRQVFFTHLWIQCMIFRISAEWVSPFGHPRVNGCLGPFRGLSHPATSFIVYNVEASTVRPFAHCENTKLCFHFFVPYIWLSYKLSGAHRFFPEGQILSHRCHRHFYRGNVWKQITFYPPLTPTRTPPLWLRLCGTRRLGGVLTDTKIFFPPPRGPKIFPF